MGATTFSIMTLSILTRSIMTLSITTLSVLSLFVAHNINDLKHFDPQNNSIKCCFVELHHSECYYTQRHSMSVIVLNVIMLNVATQCVIMISRITLSVNTLCAVMLSDILYRRYRNETT